MSNSYVIFAGKSQDELQPVKTAPDCKTAISEAISLETTNNCVEAIFMPEDNESINITVYAHYKTV